MSRRPINNPGCFAQMPALTFLFVYLLATTALCSFTVTPSLDAHLTELEDLSTETGSTVQQLTEKLRGSLENAYSGYLLLMDTEQELDMNGDSIALMMSGASVRLHSPVQMGQLIDIMREDVWMGFSKLLATDALTRSELEMSKAIDGALAEGPEQMLIVNLEVTISLLEYHQSLKMLMAISSIDPFSSHYAKESKLASSEHEPPRMRFKTLPKERIQSHFDSAILAAGKVVKGGSWPCAIV